MSLPPPLSAAAERNKEPILAVLAATLPPRACVLEVASGTGQHVLHFAARLSGVTWQPSEANAVRCDALAAHLALAPHANVLAPFVLDVEQGPWPAGARFDAVLCINMIHIAPWSATRALINGAAAVLAPGGAGLLILYGPYREEGRHTAPSNAQFDESLRARDPTWGVRELGAVSALAAEYDFERRRVERMPANNLCIVFGRGASRG